MHVLIRLGAMHQTPHCVNCEKELTNDHGDLWVCENPDCSMVSIRSELSPEELSMRIEEAVEKSKAQ